MEGSGSCKTQSDMAIVSQRPFRTWLGMELDERQEVHTVALVRGFWRARRRWERRKERTCGGRQRQRRAE